MSNAPFGLRARRGLRAAQVHSRACSPAPLARFAALVALALAPTLPASGCAGPVSEADAASARIHHDIGVTSLGHGDLRGSLRELLVAVELDPDMAETHNALGLVYHAMDHSKEALQHYERAVTLKPAFSEAHNNFGVLLIDLGRYGDAVEHFKKALGDILYPTPALAEGNMGWAYYKSGEVDTGRRHLRNAVAQSPQFCRGYLWLARIGIDTGDAAETVASAKRFEKHCTGDAEVARNLTPAHSHEMRYYVSMAYLKQGDRAAARQSLAACAQAGGDSEFGPKCAQLLRSLD